MKGKEYRRPIRPTWWLGRRAYTLFMLREATALFVGGYAVFLLVLLYRASQGSDAWSQFVQGLRSPLSIVLHLIALAMAIYHTVTWFQSTPKVLVVWRGEERVSPAIITAANYVFWLVVSAVVAGLALAAR